ncbi:MAG: hypothetical protein WBF03_21145, partial [Xanthobacteraceae bacterium]
MRGNIAGPKGVYSTSARCRGLSPVKTKVVSLGLFLLKRQNSPISSILRGFCSSINAHALPALFYTDWDHDLKAKVFLPSARFSGKRDLIF